MKKVKLSFVAVTILLGAAAGCSPSATTSSEPPSGKITIRGSNTVGEKLVPELIAAYQKEHPTAVFDLEAKGTSYGFGALVGGFCDIAGASRTPNKNELEVAQYHNVELDDHPIGFYGVAVVVNSGNAVNDLTKAQVRDLFTGAITNWSAVGGPDAAVHRFIRDPVSGTYLGFKELAMENQDYAPPQDLFTNYEEIIAAVSKDPDGIGYSSPELANQPGVKVIAIGGMKPDEATVNSGTYPYARKLHLFTNKERETPETLDFIQFVLSPAGQKTLAQAGDLPLQ